MRYIYCIILYFLITSCNSEKKELKKVINFWIGKNIDIPTLQAKIAGRDTIFESWKNKKFKILHYVDTTGCTSCKLKLYEWTLIMRQLEQEMPEVGVLFILTLNNYKEFEQEARINQFIWPVLYDPEEKLNLTNHLPNNPTCQTFLLDAQNKVIGVGNPARNKFIWQFYQKKIKSLIN